MRRNLALALAVVVLAAGAQAQQQVSEVVRQARHVHIVPARTGAAQTAEDRRVLAAVEQAFRDWGHYIVTIDPAAADLIVEVRVGQRGAVFAGGRVGGPPTWGGPQVGAEAGSGQDAFVVSTPRGGVLWSYYHARGLEMPVLPAFQAFRRAVEQPHAAALPQLSRDAARAVRDRVQELAKAEGLNRSRTAQEVRAVVDQLAQDEEAVERANRGDLSDVERIFRERRAAEKE